MKNALLCFLKYPESGHVKTRLAPDLGPSGAADLYSALAERVITEVFPLNASYELLLYTDPTHDITLFQQWLGDTWSFYTQQGADLGARLHHAFTRTFEQGFEKVIVIGTDCIGMDETFMEAAFRNLDSSDFVIGPSSDGGYYLLALKQNHSWLFERMDWGTDRVLETTVDRIEVRDLTVHQLEEKIDIDILDDLDRFRKSLPEEHYLAKKIDQIVLERLTTGTQTPMTGDNYRTKVVDKIVLD